MFYFTYKFKFATISFDANRLVVIILCPIEITKKLIFCCVSGTTL